MIIEYNMHCSSILDLTPTYTHVEQAVEYRLADLCDLLYRSMHRILHHHHLSGKFRRNSRPISTCVYDVRIYSQTILTRNSKVSWGLSTKYTRAQNDINSGRDDDPLPSIGPFSRSLSCKLYPLNHANAPWCSLTFLLRD